MSHQFQPVRRKVLLGGITAAALFGPARYCAVWAQSDGAAKLLQLPKVALVLGNGKYKDSPLRNPPNDARAIAETLKQCGFDVTARIDAGRGDMAAAVAAYAKRLAARDCVGLFYYAGHGLQLAWRNYMLPIDANISNVADVQKEGIDVTALLSGIGKAGNSLNVIILDACRDNPFGTLKGVDQKGLSQMDAPPGTLLAYATSPGNVASDGEGVNGLYTEYLLREMKVPDAKIEDVFKRVRLGVRRTSKGQQIPWESTSLEQDFWFIPPKQLARRTEDDERRTFDEMLAQWEKVKGTQDPAQLEAFLRNYPSSEFSELAQLRLDALLAAQGEKRIAVASQDGNPFSKGYARADTNFKVGDFYSYRLLDMATGAEKRILGGRITAVTDTEVIIAEGTTILDRMGNTVKNPEGIRFTDNQNAPLEFYVGRKWSTQYRTYPPKVPENIRVMTEMDYRIVGRETVKVPAGTFDCYRIEGRGTTSLPKGRVSVENTYWYAPERVRRFVAQEFVRKPPPGAYAQPLADRYELIDFRQT